MSNEIEDTEPKPRTIEFPSMVLDMPAAEYHAREEISKHGLDVFSELPARFKYERENPEETTAAMRFGSLVHLAVLEPELFESSVAFIPEDAPRKPSDLQRNAKKPSPETAAAVEWWDNFLARIAGKEIITPTEHAELCGIRDAIHAHPVASKLLALPGHVEPSLFWTDAETGIACRSRMDKVIPKHRIIIDLKTCVDASQTKFSKDCANFRYDVQSAIYPDAAQAVLGGEDWRFLFIAVEKSAPYFVAVYEADEVMRFAGREKYRSELSSYAACVESGKWPAHPDIIAPISLPAWAIR